MDLTLCEEVIDFENLNTGVFKFSKHVFIHWFNRAESYRTIRKKNLEVSKFFLFVSNL